MDPLSFYLLDPDPHSEKLLDQDPDPHKEMRIHSPNFKDLSQRTHLSLLVVGELLVLLLLLLIVLGIRVLPKFGHLVIQVLADVLAQLLPQRTQALAVHLAKRQLHRRTTCKSAIKSFIFLYRHLDQNFH